MERNKQRIAQKLGETPKKPLNVDENENEKEKENDDVEYIQSPAAMEPTRGSGGTIGSSSSLIQDRDSGPGLSVSFAMEDAPWISQLVEEMSQTELIERYEHAIDKIALSKVESRELNSEGALAVEAALILQRYDQLPTFKEAKGVVIRDIQAAVQQIQESRNEQISRSEVDDENDEPF